METTEALAIDENKLNTLLGTMVNELGAAAMGSLIMIGEQLGLYKTLSASGALSSQDLADKTETNERYVREWLSAQAGSGFIEYDKTTGKFSMTPEQVAVFGEVDSNAYIVGGYFAVSSIYHDTNKLAKAFKTGDGFGWGEHCNCLFCGTKRFFAPTYRANLTQNWIPSLGGVEAKLVAGAKVADIGCGFGASTIIMAKQYPNSKFIGFDIHAPSIEEANKAAEEEGLSNCSFEAAAAKDFPGTDYDFICNFDSLHDMGDPAGASAHAYQALASGGTWMIVEPMAGDALQDNLNPVGRVYYAFSTAVCTPTSLSQEVGTALGAQAGEKRLAEEISKGGFSSIRRAAETPFNMILEATK